MPRMPLESLGALVRERRGRRKLREVAREIGIGPATLLRVEGGHVPDVATFGKICKWLGEDPGKFLGIESPSKQEKERSTHTSRVLMVSAHLKADQTPKPETVQALAQMLLIAANTHPDAPEN